MQREEITSVLGPVDETVIAEINRIGGTREELAEAWAWVVADEAMLNEGRKLPTGRITELVAVLEAMDMDDQG